MTAVITTSQEQGSQHVHLYERGDINVVAVRVLRVVADLCRNTLTYYLAVFAPFLTFILHNVKKL
jgi:hypothetical protein